MTHNNTYPDNLRCCGRTRAATYYRDGYARGYEYIAPCEVNVPDHDTDPYRHHSAIGFIDGNAERCANLTPSERAYLAEGRYTR